MRKKEVFNVTFSAVMLSFAVVLELFFKFVLILDMPNGGGLSLAMLPLIVASIVCGWQYGLAVGFGYGILDCFLLDGYSFSLASFLLDYMAAYLSVAVAAVFRKHILDGKKLYFILAVVCVFAIRWLANSFSGIVNAEVWGYDQEFLEGMFGAGKGSVIYLYIYSFIIYNLPYLSVTCAMCAVVGVLSYRVLFLKFNQDNVVE
ncbi:MAG: energy-coupled thiamine transporter ThiT [Bacilli bacterium]|nr:energy-coupled thiamine transporter ThiT [Bacilli bacterium]